MTTKLVALFILSSALAVFGREPLPAATYALVLEQVSIPGHITGIVEGDTIKVRILAKPEIKVRIAFIDAPEKGQPFGERAKQALSKLVFDKEVELRPHTVDRYGLNVKKCGRDSFQRPSMRWITTRSGSSGQSARLDLKEA